ncbi:N-ethylmaleimide reductase [Anseongella ginsenosidimutans]|uniref:N-ethylmaleimide reductase n=1 Tax=Anseongella ginsenosidimutans TaxID=496056 RepID=A0A4R3KXJ0_9SPHI|nr:alkene reductase [Anseongella ginsenosidimutans]QEC51150.1 alkene reductase [Anseongella ginsenosidimutans]TCS90178.1 N-ethylmaleimide reductase [Anseongella ginsenosidimutans]
MESQINNSPLFSPLAIQGLELKNRIVMAPMTRSRAPGAVPNDLMASYYAQRATAGLIIAEGTAPSPSGLGYSRIPGIFNESQVAGWKKVTGAVHARGGRIFLQLMHTGRVAHPDNLPEGTAVIAPSPIQAEGEMWTDTNGMQALPVPREMSPEDIQQTINEYVKAAENAVEAGFDGVEIHAANGYLPGQFLNPHSNKRTDAYGGDIAGRSRFILELGASIARAIGPEKTGVRLSPYSTFNSMHPYEETFETYDYLSAELDKLNLVYIHLVEPAARELEEGRRLVEKIRSNFRNLFIANGGYSAESAAEAVENDQAHLVSFGAPFISNPDLAERIQNNLQLEAADPGTFYTPGEKGYIDYPFYSTEISQ